MRKLKVGVALSGGAICGVAHISFLKVLEENGIKIDMISGISMGSVVGGLYASGMQLKDMEIVVKSLSKNDIIEVNFFKLLKEGIFSGKRIEKILNEYLKVENIEDAKIKFYAQAADLKTGELYTFEKGPFVEAIRASTAIPGVFTPIYKNDTVYVDGGIIHNIPYKILKEKGADVIIAVNCLNEYKVEETPKSTISLVANALLLTNDIIWKHNKETYKDCYDIFCTNATENVSPLSTNFKEIPRILETGKKAGEKYIFEIKDIIEKKKKLLKNTWFYFDFVLILNVNYG